MGRRGVRLRYGGVKCGEGAVKRGEGGVKRGEGGVKCGEGRGKAGKPFFCLLVFLKRLLARQHLLDLDSIDAEQPAQAERSCGISQHPGERH